MTPKQHATPDDDPFIDPLIDPDEIEGDDAQDLPEELRDAGVQPVRYTLSKDSNHRLDKFLQNRIKGFSRHQIQRLISLGSVSVSRKNTQGPATKLKRAAIIDMPSPPRPAVDLSPEPIPLEILHEEHGFIVVNKQAGLIVHPARSHLSGTLLNALWRTTSSNPKRRTPKPARAKRLRGRSARSARSTARAPASSTGSTKTPPASSSSPSRTTGTGSSPNGSRDRHEPEEVYLAVVHGCQNRRVA
ncbi:MAG: hypothetical protein R3C45_10360 [Phycisphaerales bacterium]